MAKANLPSVVDEIAVVNTKITELDNSIAQQVGKLIAQQKALATLEKELREKLIECFESEETNPEGLKSVENDYIKATYCKASTRTGVDVAELRKNHPEIYNKFEKTTNVKSSVTITVKEQDNGNE